MNTSCVKFFVFTETTYDFSLKNYIQIQSYKCSLRPDKMCFGLVFGFCFSIITVVPKRIVHPKMKMLSLITNPHVVPNLQDFLSSLEYK